jgi:uncharacterized protein
MPGLSPRQKKSRYPMKLHTTTPTDALIVTAYDATGIAVAGRRLTRSFVLTAQRVIEDWPPGAVEKLCMEDMELLATLACPIVLLGTGRRQRFPSPSLLRLLTARGIGIEVMDSFAACRTYNILIAEGRQVAAALILEAE